MAHMYPEGGPTNATTSDAERHVYDLLAHSLDDSYSVIHSTPLLDKRPNGRFLDGEIDFIITHPQLGILPLEVKGGGIAYDGATKQWSSTNRQCEIQPIKDPFQQAKDGMYRLKRHLARVSETNPYADVREYWLSYGVWWIAATALQYRVTLAARDAHFNWVTVLSVEHQ